MVRGDYYIAPGCQIVGTVDIWFNTVIRADHDWVYIGDNTNIKDGSVLHVDPGKPITIGKNVAVGHKVILHGCTIADECLIPENKEIPDGSLVMGSPGKVIRKITQEEIARLKMGGQYYVDNAKTFKAGLLPFSVGSNSTGLELILA